MPIKFPCGICKKPVAVSHHAIQCDTCSYWVHIKCNHTTNNEYTRLIESDEAWSCLRCIQSEIPFKHSSNEELKLMTQGKPISDIKLFDPDENINIQFFKDIEKVLHNEEFSDSHISSFYHTLSEINEIKMDNAHSISHAPKHCLIKSPSGRT